MTLPILYLEDVRGIVEQVLDEKLESLALRLLKRLEERKQRPELDASILINEKDIADLLGCDRRTVRRLERSQAIPPSFRIGGSKRWRRADIEDWISRLGNRTARPNDNGSRGNAS